MVFPSSLFFSLSFLPPLSFPFAPSLPPPSPSLSAALLLEGREEKVVPFFTGVHRAPGTTKHRTGIILSLQQLGVASGPLQVFRRRSINTAVKEC